MTLPFILSHVDHTLLKPTMTTAQLRETVADAARYGCASACIPPCFVKEAVAEAAGRVRICTVIGFPLGYQSTEVKCFETEQAVRDGADEIDMVIHIGAVKEGRYDDVLDEIRRVRGCCEGKILKVIIETCLLTDEEKIRMCDIVGRSGADYIKTSTGISTGGATLDDIRLFAAHVPPHLRIKAAGGISSVEDAEAFLQAGADRLGTSRLVAAAKAGM